MNILHRNLCPSSIFLDDFLFPKIGGLVICEEYKDINNYNSNFYSKGYGSPFYVDPNVYKGKENKSSDVFSFSLIMYQIIMNQFPYDEFSLDLFVSQIKDDKRLEFDKPIPECYKELIEKCWDNDQNKRPTFEEISFQLKTDPRFITETVNKEEFMEYVCFIDNLIKQNKMKNPTFNKVKIDLKKKDQKMHFSANMETVDLKKFVKKEKIGKGGFGNVYKVIEKETGEEYAAKVSIYEIDQCTEEMIMNLSREVEIVSQLNHSTIMKFIGYNPHNFNMKSKPTIITEYLKNSSLDKIIELERRGFGNFDWDDTKKLINIYGIASGMKFMHSHNILLDDS